MTPETHDHQHLHRYSLNTASTATVRRDNELDRQAATGRRDYVGFLIGCSFSFEEALMREGIEVRHIAQGRNVPIKPNQPPPHTMVRPCAP